MDSPRRYNPPIITKEVFDQAQAALTNANHLRPIEHHTPYLLTGFIRCSKCGSTIGGTTLNRKYRYYQCRGARPTSTRGKICNQGYIKADELESFVWTRFTNLMSSPLTLLTLLTDLGYNSTRNIHPMLDNQIKQLRKKLKTYPAKEKNLYELLSYQSVTKDYVLDVIGKLRQSQHEDETQLNQLLQSRKSSAHAPPPAPKLSELSDAIKAFSADGTLQQKRTMLQGTHVTVLASPGAYKFTCYIDTELTSDYQEPMQPHWQRWAEELEALHPEITLQDLIDHGKLLPEDTALGRMTNQVKKNIKNLVTIEQTSA